MYAASAIAANTVARSLAGAAAPLFTNYMFTSLGVGGGGSLVAGVACLLAPIPFAFHRYGRKIREKSRFAPTPEKQPDDKKDEEAAPERASSHIDSSDEDEMALDEEAGVPNQSELEKEIEKERSASRSPAPQEQDADRFIDASGMEKAERISC